jgi:hypothetical protein
MGIGGPWPHILKKGYWTTVFYAPLAALAKLKEGAKQHDVLGSIFSTIRYAFSTSTVPDEKAHAIVERRLRPFASTFTSILYMDGELAQEKKDVRQARANQAQGSGSSSRECRLSTRPCSAWSMCQKATLCCCRGQPAQCLGMVAYCMIRTCQVPAIPALAHCQMPYRG